MVVAVMFATILVWGSSQAGAAVTIEREVPVNSSNPYTPVSDGSVWTTYATSGSGGTVLHLDGQNGSIIDSFFVATNGYNPQAIGYANNRVYILEPGQILSLQVNGPSGTTNPGLLGGDGETSSRLTQNGGFLRVGPDGTGNLATYQSNTVAILNLSDLTAGHPFYPQSFFGGGVNGGGTSFQSCEIDGPGTAAQHCGQSGGAGGSAPGQFDYPTDMAPDSANGFFVTEYNGNTVSHVSVTLNGVSADYNFGSGPGSAAGQLSSPDSIRRIPATGRLVISNPPNRRIDEFSPTGDYERSYGFGVRTGADVFETCGVGIGQCQAGVPYQSNSRSYFSQLDVVGGKLWAATEVDHSIQVIGGISPPPVRRPDELIKLSGDAHYIGNNIYNLTAVNQTRRTTANRGQTKTFVIKDQNDGNAPDAFKLSGPGSSSRFTVKYLVAGIDRTAGVVAGTYSTGSLAPGAAKRISLKITVRNSAPSGASKAVLVTAKSTHNANRKDAVKAKVTVP